MRRALAVLITVFAFVAAALSPPARAGAAEFSDEKGDATGLEAVPSTPRPNDAELDILHVSFRSSTDTLFIVAKFDKIGTPPYATGATRTVGFTYDGADYNFRFQSPAPPQDLVSGTGLYFRDGLGTTIPCARCSGKLDVKAGTLSITAAFSSMSAGIKASKATSPPLKPGAKFTKLKAAGLRTASLLSFTADTAAAKPDLVFTL